MMHARRSGLLTVVMVGLVAIGTRAEVKVYQTVEGGAMRQLPSESVHVGDEEAWMTPIVDLDAAKESHPYLGLGGSFAEASCDLLMKLDPEQRRAILRDLFTPEGLGLSMGRLHVGSSDYSTSLRTYDDGAEDPKLERFSIDGDRARIIPVVKEALAICPDLYLYSSTWTPPGWMKTNGGLNGGWMLSRWLEAYADYYVKYLLAYREAGIPIRALTIQNEPQCGRPGSPTCLWHPEQEMKVVGELLPPRLKSAGLDVKIWLWDHNYDGFKTVLDELKDERVLKAIDAVAWHPYCGDPAMLERVRKVHPNLRFQQTEIGPNIDPKAGRTLIWWCDTVFGAFNHGCSSFNNWCLVLDPNGYPNTSEGLGCAGLIALDPKTGAVEPSLQYRVFKHIGPFVKRGGSVLSTSFTTEGYYPDAKMLRAVAFRNPDGTDVVVVGVGLAADGNPLRRRQFQFRKNGRCHSISLPCNTVTTFVIGK